MSSLIDIRPGEWRRLLPLTTAYSLVLGSVYVLKPVRNALFLDRIGIAQLPYVLLLVALIGGLAATAYGRFSRKVRIDRLIAGTYAALAATLVLFHWLFESQQDWVYYVFYIWVNLYGLLAVSLLWLLANATFNPREARRLFGFIGTGGIAGAIVGGVFTGWAVEHLGTEDLLWVCVGVLGVCIALVRCVGITAESGEDSPPAATVRSPVTRIPLLKMLALMGAITAVVAAIVDVQFNQIANESFPTKDAKTAFFGEFFAWLNGFALLFQLILTPRILRRLGVGPALTFLPAATALGAVGALALPGLLGGLAVKIGDIGFRHSIHKSAVEILYLPIPADLKRRAKVFLDTTVDNLATGLGAILVLVLTSLGVSYRDLSYVSLAFVGLWGVLLIRTHRAYVDAFRRALDRREINVADVRTTVSGADIDRVLLGALESANPRHVNYALETLAVVGASNHATAVIPLLAHESSEVRRNALRLLAEAGGGTDTGEVTPLLRDPELDVRIEAVHYLVEAGRTESPLVHLLNDPDPAVGVAALGYVAGYGREDARHLASPELIRSIADRSAGSAECRVGIIRAIGRMGDPRLAGMLDTVADEGDPRITRAALRAAGSLRLINRVDWMLRHLQQAVYRVDARTAITRLGEDVLDRLEADLCNEDLPVIARSHLPPVIARIPTQRSATILLGALEETHGLEFQLIKGLSKLRQLSTGLELPVDRMDGIFLGQMRVHAESVHARHLLGERDRAGPLELFHRALGEKSEQALEAAFRVLGLQYDARDVYNAYLGVVNTNRTVRASAVEFLDNLLANHHKEALIPFLDTNTPEVLIERGAALFGQKFWSLDEALAYYIQGPDAWLRACAASCVSSRRSITLRRLLEARLTDPSPIVAETARRVLEA